MSMLSNLNKFEVKQLLIQMKCNDPVESCAQWSSKRRCRIIEFRMSNILYILVFPFLLILTKLGFLKFILGCDKMTPQNGNNLSKLITLIGNNIGLILVG